MRASGVQGAGTWGINEKVRRVPLGFRLWQFRCARGLAFQV